MIIKIAVTAKNTPKDEEKQTKVAIAHLFKELRDRQRKVKPSVFVKKVK